MYQKRETLRSRPPYLDRGQKYQRSLLGTKHHDRELEKRRPDRQHMRGGDYNYYHEDDEKNYGKHSKMIKTDLDGRGHGQRYEEQYDLYSGSKAEDPEDHIHRSTYTEGRHNTENELHGRGEKSVRLYKTDIENPRKDKQFYQEYTTGHHSNGELTTGTRYTKRIDDDGFEHTLETTGEHDKKGNLKSTGLMGKATIKYKITKKDKNGEIRHELNIDNAKIDRNGHIIGGDVTYKGTGLTKDDKGNLVKDRTVEHKTTIKGRSYFKEDRTHILDPKDIQNYAHEYEEPEHEDRYEGESIHDTTRHDKEQRERNREPKKLTPKEKELTTTEKLRHDEEQRERNREQQKLTTTEKSTRGVMGATVDDLYSDKGDYEEPSAQDSVQHEIQKSNAYSEREDDIEKFDGRRSGRGSDSKELAQKTVQGEIKTNTSKPKEKSEIETKTSKPKDTKKSEFDEDKRKMVTTDGKNNIRETHEIKDKNHFVRTQGDHDRNGNLTRGKRTTTYLDGDKVIEIKSEGEHDTNGNLNHSQSYSGNHTGKITRTETEPDGNKKITEFTNVKTSEDGHIVRANVKSEEKGIEINGHIKENYTPPSYGLSGKPEDRTSYPNTSSKSDVNPMESDDIKNNIPKYESSSLTNTEKSANSASEISFSQFEQTLGGPALIPDDDQESTITSNALNNMNKASSLMEDTSLMEDAEEDF